MQLALPVLYRAWSSLRAKQAAEWMAPWINPQLRGVLTGKSTWSAVAPFIAYQIDRDGDGV